MMKMMRKWACILGFILLFVFIGGCSRSYEDVVPKSYGAKDGNYIYYRNMRCTTSGEEEETLVDSVTIDGIEYQTEECMNTAEYQDKLYMTLSCVSANADKKVCLVEYDLHTKAERMIFSGYTEETADGNTILYQAECAEDFQEDRLVLKTKCFEILPRLHFLKFIWLTIDYDGNILEADVGDFTEYERIGRGDWMRQVAHAVYYRTWGTEEVLVCEGVATDSKSSGKIVEFIDREAVKGFLIIEKTRIASQSAWKLSSLRFFDLKTGETTVLIQPYLFFDWVSGTDYEYFLTWSQAIVTDGSMMWEGDEPPKREDVKQTFTLHQICYEEDGVYVKTVHAFDNQVRLNPYIYQGKAYWYKDAKKNAQPTFSCAGILKLVNYYVLDLTTKSQSVVTADVYLAAMEQNEKTKNPGYNGYHYYVEKSWYYDEEKELFYVYYFQRYHVKTGKVACMQFWTKGPEQMKGEKYSEKLWNDETINWENFIIRNY